MPLAQFLVERGGISAAEAQAVLSRGAVFVEGRRTREPGRTLRRGAHVEAVLREGRAGAQAREVPIVHLDPQIMAVDKPAGVLAQAGRAGGPSLLDLVSAQLAARGEPSRVLLVHRLDRGTSGCTLLARTAEAQAALLAEFRAGRVEKEYLAWVRGAPADDTFAVDEALGPDPGRPGCRRADPRGEPARTRFRVLRREGKAALVAAFPETGRTHQIRVHLASRGLPLLGDGRYGGPLALTRADGSRLDFARPLLHARALKLWHPGGGPLEIFAPQPGDFEATARFLD